MATNGGLDVAPFVAVRVPLLPAGTVAGLTGGAARAAWPDGDLDAALHRDAAYLAERLRALLADPMVRTALAYASPSLAAATDRWLGTAAAPPPGLLGYVARMAGRATPFGLFATCAAGMATGRPAYDLAPRTAVRARARLDVLAADRLAAVTATAYVPNTTAHAAAERLRLVERTPDGRYVPAAIEEDDALRTVLARAAAGATVAELAAALTGDEVTEADAAEYVRALVAEQLLVPDVPVVTGAPPVPPAVAALDEDVTPDRLRAAVRAVRAAVPDVPAERAVHVDATRPAAFVLGEAVVAEARRAVEVLHRLYRETPAGADLARFAAAFGARYGTAEVPLLEALDPETGVGFGAPPALAASGAPLLSGFAAAPAREGSHWTPIDHHLVDLLSRALRDRAPEIEVPAHELHSLRNQRPRPLPDVFTLRGTVAAASADAVARGAFRLVVHDVTAGAAGVVSRFADLDPGLDALVREQVAREEALRPDAAFAEVVHLPERRSANVAVRPVLRAYEIPLLTASAVRPEWRILPADLLVSVAGERVVLRSARLDREVLPRVTAAYDAWESALPAYRFLAALAQQGVAGVLRWSWGEVDSAPYLPRVVVGRLVLARAQWRWFRRELAELREAASPAARYAAVQRLRAAWDVPRWATLAFGDRELPLDLDGGWAADLLAREARRAGQLWLREQLPGPDQLCLTGEDGGYAHEFVLPFAHRSAPHARPATRSTPRPAAHVPGTEWLGVRLATGVSAADGVLREVVAPLVAGAAEWWYERRSGPAPFLRVALRGDGLALAGAVRDAVAPLVASGRVADVTLDTYRAGADARLAHADSVAALRVLAAGDDLDARWRAAFWGVHRLLTDAVSDDGERRVTLARLRDRLVAEQGETGARALRHAGRVWRARRADLAAPDAWLARVHDQRATVLGPLLAGAPEALDALCLAHVNRLLRAAPGVQQLVLVDLVGRRLRAGR
ncbi:MAG TPA: lantibiotic dehydratase [Frankiaceae bacterium]|nr:lantibiotic dehydratase [Frankiaceae bacterium]